MARAGLVDVLRYPPGTDGPEVRAVRAGDGPAVVREAEAEYREDRRRERLPLWVALPLLAGGMTAGPAGRAGLPAWTPLVAGLVALSLLWWLFAAAEARRDPPVPAIVATDCPVAVARTRFDATVVAEPAPPGERATDAASSADGAALPGGDVATWTDEATAGASAEPRTEEATGE